MGKHKRKKRLLEYFNEQAGNCAYCLNKMTTDLGRSDTATIDHFEPTSKGGLKKKFNEIAVCSKCNNQKGDMDPIDFLRWRAKKYGKDHEDSLFKEHS